MEALLDERIADADRADTAAVARIDEEILDRFERPVAVMITDLSGLTGRTQTEGVISSLTRIRRMIHLAEPMISQRGAQLVKTEADDLFVIAENPQALFDLGEDLRRGITQWDDQHPNNSIGPIAIGLGYGPTLVLPHDVWGDSVNSASKLGEDVADGGELLVSDAFFGALDADHASRCTPGDPARASPVPFYRCR